MSDNACTKRTRSSHPNPRGGLNKQKTKKHHPTGVQPYNKRNTQALLGYALQDLPIILLNSLREYRITDSPTHRLTESPIIPLQTNPHWLL
jgi:hypothetical protein